MGYLDTVNWEDLKKDLQKSLEKGMEAVKKGALTARKRAGEVTEEGKKQYKVLLLQVKVERSISKLGARVYSLLKSKSAKNPALDASVKEIVAAIRKAEAQIAEAGGKVKRLSAPKARRKKTGRVAS
jgi:hypothetical protein